MERGFCSDSIDHVLPSHSYHKNSLSKEQLEAIAAELQKKVKVLQQRHRRHLEKLLGLENTVNQLRHSNLLHQERLQLLERVRQHQYVSGISHHNNILEPDLCHDISRSHPMVMGCDFVVVNHQLSMKILKSIRKNLDSNYIPVIAGL